ncbi:hypothetical protein HYU92_01220 [Candidatus Curtissbacteria bacterium]|nr:hypothetical protein [Candidatus Curtissbacteria bacterium]
MAKWIIITVVLFFLTGTIVGLASFQKGCSTGSPPSFEFFWQYGGRLVSPSSGLKIPIIYDGNVVGYQQEGCAPDKIVYPIEPIAATLISGSIAIYKGIAKVSNKFKNK